MASPSSLYMNHADRRPRTANRERGPWFYGVVCVSKPM